MLLWIKKNKNKNQPILYYSLLKFISSESAMLISSAVPAWKCAVNLVAIVKFNVETVLYQDIQRKYLQNFDSLAQTGSFVKTLWRQKKCQKTPKMHLKCITHAVFCINKIAIKQELQSADFCAVAWRRHLEALPKHHGALQYSALQCIVYMPMNVHY